MVVTFFVQQNWTSHALPWHCRSVARALHPSPRRRFIQPHTTYQRVCTIIFLAPQN